MKQDLLKKIFKEKMIIVSLVFVLVLILLHVAMYYYLIPSERAYRESSVLYTDWDNTKETLPYSGYKMEEHDFEAIELTKNDDGYFAEFENTFFGTLEIRFPEKLVEDTEINITVGELAAGENVWTRKYATDFAGTWVNFYETKEILPAGSSSFTLVIPERTRFDKRQMPSGWVGGITAFGYCQIRGYDGNLEKENVIQKAIYYPFDDEVFYFSSSDKKLDEVNELCKNTLKATTYAGYFVDGFREIKPYELDAYINMLGWFSVSNDPKIARVSLDYLLKNHTWPTEWMMYTIFIAHDYYMETGDKEYIKSIYPSLEKCLLEEETNENGLVDSALYSQKTLERLGIVTIQDVIDYPPAEADNFDSEVNCNVAEWMLATIKGGMFSYLGEYCDIVGLPFCSERMKEHALVSFQSRYVVSSPNSVINALYYQSLVYMADLAKEIGFDDFEKEYQNKAKKLRKTYQEAFIGEGKVYDSLKRKHSSIQSCVYALNFGLVPEKQEVAVAEYIKNKGMKCSVYTSQFLFETLYNNGYENLALEYLTAENDTSWLNMKYGIGSKLTTEAWGFRNFADMDLNHAWATVPVNITKRFIIGLSPEKAGYSITAFEPHFFNLDYVNSIVPTQKGNVSVSYKKIDKKYEIIINVPNDMNISFKISEYNFSVCKIDGLEYKNNRDIIIQEGRHIIELE